MIKYFCDICGDLTKTIANPGFEVRLVISGQPHADKLLCLPCKGQAQQLFEILRRDTWKNKS